MTAPEALLALACGDPGRPWSREERAQLTAACGRLARLYALARPHVGARIVPGWYARTLAELQSAAGPWAARLGPLRLAGAAAALSPRVRWDTVLARLRSVLETGERGPFYSRSVDKALALRDGAELAEVLRGPKTLSFAHALSGRSELVVIDVWSARAAGLDPERLTPRRYALGARAHVETAAAVGLDPSELQARLWCFLRDVEPSALAALE